MSHHSLPAAAALALLAAGCTGDPPQAPGTDAPLAPSAAVVEQQLAQLRRATVAFHRVKDAELAGYTLDLTGCMSDPAAGGMGFHRGRGELIDATVDHRRPEVLLYEPGPGGRLRLVGVEFIVPWSAWTAPDPPVLFGRRFSRNETFGLWALHVWVWQGNPAGIFADWNPSVSCKHAR